MAEPIAWSRLLRLGIRGLGLRPDEFWALTPAEFLLLAGLDGGGGPGAMTRARLAELEARLNVRGRGQGDEDERI
ncbi:MAG: hypothetical protein KatS3mg118_1116 [Paracoccaceae bacterium]|nr:MAG: phage tail assembly chaperone [Alphaproteobacteria bacterium]GIX13157.1 MAG: hypothetical protein KatS3mg118_1116 [Paracoccaceae bacterium]